MDKVTNLVRELKPLMWGISPFLGCGIVLFICVASCCALTVVPMAFAPDVVEVEVTPTPIGGER